MHAPNSNVSLSKRRSSALVASSPRPPSLASTKSFKSDAEFFKMGRSVKVAPAASEVAGARMSKSKSETTILNPGNPPVSPGCNCPGFFLPCPKFVIFLFSMMQTRRWTIFISSVTIYALFGDDIRQAFLPKSVDAAFDVFSTFALLVFLLEVTVFSWANSHQYLWTYFFWLDLIATVTMVTDISWLFTPLVDGIQGSDITSSSNSDSFDSLRDTLVGSKSSRIVRVVRLVRLVRLAKLYGISQKKQDMEDELLDEDAEPSVVGIKLADMTMKRVVTMVLLMLVMMPFLDAEFYEQSNDSISFSGLHQLHRAAQDINVSTEAFEELVFGVVRKIGNLIHISVCNEESGCMRFNIEVGGSPVKSLANGTANVWTDEQIERIALRTLFWDEELNDFIAKNRVDEYIPSVQLVIYDGPDHIMSVLRPTEYTLGGVTGCYGPDHVPREKGFNGKSCTTLAFLDERSEARLDAVFNILRTLFIAFLLLFGNLVHKADADLIVIRPIERMVLSVKRLAEDPMGSVVQMNGADGEEDQDETALLERTIKRVGQLLQIGFGEAGSRIIAKNIRQAGKTGKGFDAMVDGVKMNAIFGFCDIRNFTDTTECLQEKVMVYVNRVGKIVHEATHLFNGAANKNIGDAFLLVWRLEDDKQEERQANMCDNALLAFIKVLVDLKRENQPGGCLYPYRQNRLIKQRLGDNFEITLGMGLHLGWAIEGAIGSKYKIDASYLSPNVNMAARLEAATKQFRSSLLMSDDFFESLSSAGRRYCRIIDRVTVKGSNKPMGIYTFDIIDYPRHFYEPSGEQKDRTVRISFDSPEVEALQRSLHPDFQNTFKKAVDSYFDGNWAISKKILGECLELKPKDGPSISLLAVLERYSFLAPTNWQGYRELTEK